MPTSNGQIFFSSIGTSLTFQVDGESIMFTYTASTRRITSAAHALPLVISPQFLQSGLAEVEGWMAAQVHARFGERIGKLPSPHKAEYDYQYPPAKSECKHVDGAAVYKAEYDPTMETVTVSPRPAIDYSVTDFWHVFLGPHMALSNWIRSLEGAP